MQEKGTILFWVNTFPRYSETFVRDQICGLIDSGIKPYIIGKSFVIDQKESLKGFEKYELQKRFIAKKDLKAIYILRVFELVYKMLFLILSPRFSFYSYVKNALKYKMRFFMELRLAYFCIKNKIVIIHCHFGPNGEAAAKLKKIGLDIKLITTFHGYDIRESAQNPQAFSTLKQFGDMVLAISPYNREVLSKSGFLQERIVDLPNGVNTDFYKPIEDNNAKDRIDMLTVGRLVEEKAYPIAIKAMAAIIEQHPGLEIVYTIIGEGPERKTIEELINQYQLTHSIVLVGVKNSFEVRQFLANASLFLLPSIKEAFPTVLLEAQAAGLPIVATDVGGVRQMVRHAKIAVPGNSDHLITAISQSIKERKDWKNQGLENRAFVMDNYDKKITTQKLLEVYTKCFE